MNPILIRIPRTASTSICHALGKHFNHYPASKIKEIYKDDWDRSFKFTIVRNPYDRFISMFKDFTKGVSIENFLKSDFTQDIRFKPQSYYLDEPIDYIGRYEELNKFWDYICGKLGHYYELPHKRQNKPEQIVLTNELKKILRGYYIDDFELLNY